MEVAIQTLSILILLQIGYVFMWDSPKFADPGQFPHLVSIQWSISQEIANIHSCSGAIITNLWILSSGYCIAHIPMTSLSVNAGYYNISNIDQHVQSVGVAKKILHKKYESIDIIDLARYDIGMLKLKEPLVFNDRVQPIELPRKPSWFTGFKLNYNTVASGWGSIGYSVFPETEDIMRTVNLPIVPNKVCMDSIRAELPNIQLHDTQMCTRPLDGSLAACIEDYGAPLVQYDDKKKVVVVGIRTWSWSPCNTYGVPPVYIRVALFIKWIDQTIKEN